MSSLAVIGDGRGRQRTVRIEGRVEMGEQCTSAGCFPFEGRAQVFGGECDQEQIGLIGKMFVQCGAELVCGGEVNEAVASVIGGSFIGAGNTGSVPFRGGADLINLRHARTAFR